MLNHEPLRLADGEYRFACLVWDNEPLPSGQSVSYTQLTASCAM